MTRPALSSLPAGYDIETFVVAADGVADSERVLERLGVLPETSGYSLPSTTVFQ